jgi:prepilin-type processing-associated H-X9-DG protein
MVGRLTLALTLFLSPLIAQVAQAQPLSDRVPADALVYVGWQGSERLPAAYDNSRLKAALDTSGLRQFVDESIPQLMRLAARQDREAEHMVAVLNSLVLPMLKHPTAVYFAGVDFGQQPVPKFAILCDAGPQADAIVQQLNQLLAMAGQAPFPVMAYKHETLAVLSVGYAKQGDAVATADKSITSAPAFKAAMAHAGKEPMFVAYADTAAGMALVEKIGQQVNDADFNQNWPKVRDALGLAGLKQLICTAGFDGQDWGSQIFIAAPAPRKGLLAMLDAKPLSDEALAAVPRTANWMIVARFDIAGFLKGVREAGANFDPNFPRMFDQGVGAAQAATMVNPMQLFESFGDEWAIFVDPNTVGIGPLGLTAVNRLRDPAVAEQNLKKLHTALDNVINSNLPRENPPIRINFATSKVGDLTVYHVKAPFFSPAWTIKDGNLYAGLYVQTVTEAASRGGSKQGSILENEKFQALRTRLGNAGRAQSLSFVDLQDTAKENYQFLLLASQVAHGFADMFGAETPAFLIPPLKKLMPHLAPAGGVTWTDDAGWHARGVEPFPGSQALASQGGLVLAAAPLAVGVAVPATFKARQQAERVRAASNLRQIGMGCMLYANENRGKYPPDLGALLQHDLNPDVFVTGRGAQVPPDVRAAAPDVQAQWVNKNADFVYLGAGLNANVDAAADRVVAHEKFELGVNGGINVLFADGHVEWMPTQMAMDRVEQQKKPK